MTHHLSDVSRLDFGDRVEHYRKQVGAYDFHVGTRERKDLCDLADQDARDEMLQEVHTMLCHLCKIEEQP